MGRPKRIFTQEEIDDVERLAAVLRMEDIADFLGIHSRTLRKRMSSDAVLRAAYDRGRAIAKADVGLGLLQKARSGNIAAMIFFAKTQMGWRETDRHEHINIDLEDLTDEQLEQVARGEYPNLGSR